MNLEKGPNGLFFLFRAINSLSYERTVSKMKKDHFVNSFVSAIGMALGFLLIKKVSNSMSDPVRKARLKRWYINLNDKVAGRKGGS